MSAGLARLESNVETLMRDMTEARADIRDMRTEFRSEIGGLRLEIGGLRSQMTSQGDSLKAAIDRNFMWTLGVILTMWVTLIVALIAALLVR